MTRPTLIALTGALVVALLGSSPATAGPTAYRPDSMVRVGTVSFDPADYSGFGHYSLDGSGQTVTKSVKAGKTAKFFFVAFNGGDQVDDLTATGCASTGKVKVKWFYNAVPATADLIAGLDLQDIDTDLGKVIAMEASLKKGVKRGSITCDLDVASQNAPALHDVARAKATFRA